MKPVIKEKRYLMDIESRLSVDPGFPIGLLDDGTLEELKSYLVLDKAGNEIGFLEPYE